MAQLHGPLPESCRLPMHYVLDLITDRTHCPHCGVALLTPWTSERRPVGILLGRPLLRHHIKWCPKCHGKYPYEELSRLLPPHGNYAYDLISEVGIRRFLRYRQIEEIRRDIMSRYGLALPAGSIPHICRTFLDLFAAVHYGRADRISSLIKAQGWYFVHLDGTCEGGTDVLFTIIDGQTRLVLVTARMKTENPRDIRRAIDKCIELFGLPLATMRDLSPNICAARKHLDGTVKDLICQYHFLENVGKRLLDKPEARLRALMRKEKICPKLRSLRKELIRYSRDRTPISKTELNYLLEHPEAIMRTDPVQFRRRLAHVLLRWVEKYTKELTGERRPFDRPELTLYRRCTTLHESLEEELRRSSLKPQQLQTIQTIEKVLRPLREDPELIEAAKRVQDAAELFDQLRKVLQFSGGRARPLRRHLDTPATRKQAGKIKERLTKFRRRLEKIVAEKHHPGRQNDAKIILKSLNKHWDQLHGHVIKIPGTDQTILIPRTNACCEQHFAGTKRGWRRQGGNKKLARRLQGTRDDELLVPNLNNRDYLQAVYDGDLANLPTLFAQYCGQAAMIRKARAIPPEHAMAISKEMLESPDLLQKAMAAIRKLAACLT